MDNKGTKVPADKDLIFVDGEFVHIRDLPAFKRLLGLPMNAKQQKAMVNRPPSDCVH